MPVPPSVAVQTTKLLAAKATAAQLAEVIGTNAALTAEILTVASSQLPAAGASVEILADAIEVLGKSAVHSVVMTSAMVQLAQPDLVDTGTTRSDALVLVPLVRSRCIVNAVVTRAVADLLCPELVDDVFLASLLGAVGHYVVAAQAPPAYALFIDLGGGWPDSRHVVASLGIGLDEVTAQLLRSWGMPDRLTTALRRRSGQADQPGLAGDGEPLSVDGQFSTILRLGLLAENAIFNSTDASAMGTLLLRARLVPELDLLTLSEVLVAADEIAARLSSEALGATPDRGSSNSEQRPFGDRLRGELLEDELGILPTAGAAESV